MTREIVSILLKKQIFLYLILLNEFPDLKYMGN